MTKIKSAYELANERLIASTYRPIEYSDDMVDLDSNIQNKHTDFIESWKNPHGKEEHKDIEFVDHIEKEKFKAEKEKPIHNIKVIDAQTYHYEFTPEINWNGKFTSYDAYGRISRAMAFGLSNKNVRVKINVKASRVDINESTINELKILENQTNKQDCLRIYHEEIPTDIKGNNILYTSVDRSSLINPKIFNKFREIWVNSSFSKKKLDGLVSVPVYKIPYGVDTERYNPSVKPLKINIDLNEFVFLTVSKWKGSKGVFNLLKSYLETFSVNDNVSLLMVVKDSSSKQISDDFRRIRKTVKKKDEELPHVVVYDKPISEKNMPGLYAMANVYVLLSENERNGLTYLESGASGKPVIACECEGTSDFIKEDTCFMIKKGQDIVSQSSLFMKISFNNQEIAKAKAVKLRSIVANYNWDKSINIIYNRILDNIGD